MTKIRINMERPAQTMTKFVWSMLHRHNEVFKLVIGHGRCRGIHFIDGSGEIGTRISKFINTVVNTVHGCGICRSRINIMGLWRNIINGDIDAVTTKIRIDRERPEHSMTGWTCGSRLNIVDI